MSQLLLWVLLLLPLFSCQTLLGNQQEATSQIHSNPELGRTLRDATLALRQAKYEKAKSLLDRIDESKVSTPGYQFDILFIRGLLFVNADWDYDQGIECMHQCVDIAVEADLELREWRALSQLGTFANFKGRNLMADHYHQRALDFALKMGNEDLVARSKLAICKSFVSLGALEEAEEVIRDVDYVKGSVRELEVKTRLARIALKKGTADGSIELLESHLKGKAPDTWVPFDSFLVLGQAYLRVGDFDQAEKSFDHILSIEGIQTRAIVFEARIGKANVALGRGNYRRSLELLDELLTEQWTGEIRKRLLTRKYAAAFAEGEHKLAKSTFHEINRCDRAIHKERIKDELQFMDRFSNYQIQVLEKQKSEKDLLLLKNQLRNSRVIQYLGLATALLVIVGVVFASNSLLKKRMAEKELAHQSRLLKQETKLNAELKVRIQSRVDELETQQREQLRLEHQLNIKRRDEALGKLTGGVAHDFNNLIMVVQNVNELISDHLDTEHAPNLKELLACSGRAAKSAAEITNRLLMFAKRQSLKCGVVELNGFFDDYWPLLGQAAGVRNQLELVSDENVRILADETQLLSALINLCANASFALANQKDGPRIMIVVRRFFEKIEEPELAKRFVSFASLDKDSLSNDLVSISVSDNGCGMSETELQKACDPFYSTKSEVEGLQFGGTGLGLSVVKGFLEQSRAGLDLFSEPDVGTSVRMTFPVCELEPDAQESVIERGRSLAGLRVALVDDNEMLLQSLKLTLESLECVVVPFSSGSLAQERLAGQFDQFDLVLTDIRMPNSIDGIALARWIAENGSLPVVLMTGFSEQQVLAEFPVVQKPFSCEQLQETILATIKDREAI